MSEALRKHTESAGFTREAYNAIQKARKVTEYLVEYHAARIEELVRIGLNQTQIAEALSEEELADYAYGTAEILRTATSEAVRTILSPENAEKLRLRSWRNSLAAIPEHVKQEGRRKGREKSHAEKDWKPEEEAALMGIVSECTHGPESRYRGKPDWERITAAMHALPEFRQRVPNAYKQRYSILRALHEASVERDGTLRLPRTADTAAPLQRAEA